MKTLKKIVLVILLLIGLGITIVNFIPETITADGYPNWTLTKEHTCPEPYGPCYYCPPKN